MGKRKDNKETKINPNLLPAIDPYQNMVISGVTKAGIHKDRKKEKNKKQTRKSRQKYNNDSGDD